MGFSAGVFAGKNSEAAPSVATSWVLGGRGKGTKLQSGTEVRNGCVELRMGVGRRGESAFIATAPSPIVTLQSESNLEDGQLDPRLPKHRVGGGWPYSFLKQFTNAHQEKTKQNIVGMPNCEIKHTFATPFSGQRSPH